VVKGEVLPGGEGPGVDSEAAQGGVEHRIDDGIVDEIEGNALHAGAAVERLDADGEGDGQGGATDREGNATADGLQFVVAERFAGGRFGLLGRKVGHD